MEKSAVDTEKVNRLLKAWHEGSRDAFNEVIGLLNEDLSRIAHRQFRRERVSHTLQTGDLVHKLYLKLLKSPNPNWTEYGHFLNAAARSMRQILIDHARVWSRRADGKAGVPIMEKDVGPEDAAVTAYLNKIVGLNKAIEQIEALDPQMARITDLKLVLGLTLAEIAQELKLDLNRVKREWLMIKKFLAEKI
ncbi:MAG: ECF-type sigma factor [Acidobacteriota bacterium]|nr:ECF-type sigma factor [Acidobacteriota bacterium]